MRNKRKLFLCFAGIFGIITLASMIAVIDKVDDYNDANRKYADLSKDVTSETALPKISEQDDDVLPDDNRIPPIKIVNFSKLREINKDLAAWIDFGEEVGIDYPVVHESADFYMTHNFYKEKNSNGCLVVDDANSIFFDDLNTAVWGHNMKSKKMFGKLNSYREEKYYKDHPYFWVYTETENILYKIISVHDIEIESPAFWITFPDRNAEDSFLDAVWKNQKYETEDVFSKYDNYVTLCTCDGDYDFRYLVHGRAIYKSHREDPADGI